MDELTNGVEPTIILLYLKERYPNINLKGLTQMLEIMFSTVNWDDTEPDWEFSLN